MSNGFFSPLSHPDERFASSLCACGWCEFGRGIGATGSASMVGRPILALLLARGAMCNVYTYQDAPLVPDIIQYRRVGMWAPMDRPTAGTAPSRRAGDGSSSVSVELTFQRSASQPAGLIQVLVFHAEQLPRIGTQVAGHEQQLYCCSHALAARGVAGCTRVGELIVRPDAASAGGSADHHHKGHHHHIASHDVIFAANQTKATVRAPNARTFRSQQQQQWQQWQ